MQENAKDFALWKAYKLEVHHHDCTCLLFSLFLLRSITPHRMGRCSGAHPLAKADLGGTLSVLPWLTNTWVIQWTFMLEDRILSFHTMRMRWHRVRDLRERDFAIAGETVSTCMCIIAPWHARVQFALFHSYIPFIINFRFIQGAQWLFKCQE